MWEIKTPEPVKLITGILGADRKSLEKAIEAVTAEIGSIDLKSEVWDFVKTDYYQDQSGKNILRQFVSFEKLIDPGLLAGIKLKTNRIEKILADHMFLDLPRPVNLDPGIIEPAKLILATTKNYSHRIYIGEMIYAEVTLMYDKKKWRALPYTYPDYKQQCYFDFFEKVRRKLLEQLKQRC